MKMILSAAIAVAIAGTQPAFSKESYGECVRGMHEYEGFDIADAKRMCDPKTHAKPNQLGWVCEHGDGEFKFHKAPGGARHKRDAVCE
jgi:hypothetical protein